MILFHSSILATLSTTAVVDRSNVNNSFLLEEFVNNYIGKVFYFGLSETVVLTPAEIFGMFADLL